MQDSLQLRLDDFLRFRGALGLGLLTRSCSLALVPASELAGEVEAVPP